MPKYPDITINLPANADNSDIIITCLRAMKIHNLGNQLDAFTRDIEKGGPAQLRHTANKWFNVV